MRPDFDFFPLIENLSIYRGMKRGGRAIAVMQAVRTLRSAGLPPAYVDGLQDELLRFVCDEVPESVCDWVYLAFHGQDARATHMKIGVANNVSRRMSAISTSSPLPRLWVYSAPVVGRHLALRIESGLLDHMEGNRTNGEWCAVGEVSESAAEAMAISLAEVAASFTLKPFKFTRLEELG